MHGAMLSASVMWFFAILYAVMFTTHTSVSCSFYYDRRRR